MPFEPRRCLILGSNSPTGAHLIDHLLRETDVEIAGVSRSPEPPRAFLPYRSRSDGPGSRFRFRRLDVNRDLEALLELADRFRPDVVVNFAAQGEVRNSWRWPHEWYQTNCLAVVHLTEALRERDYVQRYLAASTPEVYGSTGVDTVENETYRPSTPYGVSKLAGDLHVQTLVRRYGFPAVFTRSANVYGIHQQVWRIVPRAAIFFKLDRVLPLHGGGTIERAFVHLRDVARGTWAAVTRGTPGDVYHLAPRGELRSIASVVETVCKLMGRDFEHSVDRIGEDFGQDARFSLDPSKAERELGWRAREDFEQGVAEVIRWVTDEWETLRHVPLDYVHVHS